MSAGRLEILMVRHAYADWVPDESRPLSAVGARDAEAVARLLIAPNGQSLADDRATEDGLDSSVPHRIPLQAIYSSPYRRAVQTVEPLAAALSLEIEIVDGLRERTLADGAVADFPAAMRASWEDLELSFPGGETSLAALERFSAAVDGIVARNPSGAVAIATHGNVLGLWLQDNDPRYDYAFWCEMSWPDVYRVSLEAGRMVGVERLWSGGVEWPGSKE